MWQQRDPDQAPKLYFLHVPCRWVRAVSKRGPVASRRTAFVLGVASQGRLRSAPSPSGVLGDSSRSGLWGCLWTWSLVTEHMHLGGR